MTDTNTDTKTPRAPSDSSLSNCYAKTADELTARILALIPTAPEILTMESVWDLFKVEGFNCSDLGPSMAQAQWALSNAKRIHSEA